jgi:3-oxoacyl-[acyl-carrier protein] reductase
MGLTHQILENQVAIVTGGTAGIGKAIVLEFARRGAKVLALGTNIERGNELVKEAEGYVGKDVVFFLQTDVSKKEQVERAVNSCLERFQKIDILVNNAGITKDNLLMRLSEEDWDKVLNTNLKSCFYTCQAVIRPFIKARRGKIINISSVVGLIGNPGQTNYAASKAGLIGFSKSLAKEVASRSITVNCIAPGFVDTHMTQAIQDKLQDIVKEIPLARMGKPEEIASCALFLASEMASYITGQVITVDGGLSM